MRVPALVLFLAVGMALGSDGLGLVDFDDYVVAEQIGFVALALILFEGGLAMGWRELRPVVRPAVALATVGTVVTAFVTGGAAYLLLDLGWLEALLVGAVLSVTDSAAIFAILGNSTLRKRLARTLEGEAGTNDPVAILLVIGLIEWINTPDYGLGNMAVLFVEELGVGTAVGLGVGFAGTWAMSRAKLATSGLYPVLTLAIVGVAFGAADVLHGSPFLATFLAGLVVGSRPIPARVTVTAFHEGTAWLAQVALFLVLGLLVGPQQLLDSAPAAIAITVVLTLVARPAAVWVSLAFERFSWREQAVLSWAGLRGGVPVVLATLPVIAGVGEAEEIFDIAFFAVLLSTVVQGTTFEALATRLGVTTDEPALPRPLVEAGAVRELGADVVEWEVLEGDAAVGRRVRELGLPREATVSLVVREESALPPRGSTRIEAGDRLHVLVRHEVSDLLRDVTERWRTGPLEGPGEVVRRPRARPVVFAVRPWTDADGDPRRAREVDGCAVADQLRTRRDAPGAVLALEDGRYALTGAQLALGSPAQLQVFARRRLAAAAGSESEAQWWRDVIGELAR